MDGSAVDSIRREIRGGVTGKGIEAFRSSVLFSSSMVYITLSCVPYLPVIHYIFLIDIMATWPPPPENLNPYL
jgi:hypothetical protein